MIRGFKIGFMPTLSYSGMDADRVCKSLKALGYDAVEWTLAHFNPRTMNRSELENVVKVTNDNGLEISEIVVQQDLVVTDGDSRKDNIEYINLCIREFSALGIDTINLFTGPVPWLKNPLVVGRDIPEGKAWQMVFEAFDIFVNEAEKRGINLAVENVWGMICHDFYTTRFLIDRYDSPRLGVNFDPSHDILAGNMDIGWIVRQWEKDRIKHVHLKDAVGEQTDGKFIFPLLGEGNVDWKGFCSALHDIDYNGVMSVEFESFKYVERILEGDMEKAAAISIESLHKLLV